MVRRESRAQLILVAAIVIGISIIGFVVILNTVLYTENVTSRSAIASTNSGLTSQLSLRSNAPIYIHHENQNQSSSTPSGIQSAINDSLAHYGDLIEISRVQQEPTSIEIETIGTPDTGALVVQDDSTRDFTNRNNDANWTLDDAAAVRQFTIFLDNDSLVADSNSEHAFAVNVTESAGSYQQLRFSRTASGNVTIERTGDTTGQCEIEPADDELKIDLWSGSVPGTSCTFAGADSMSTPEITYTNADNATGSYQLLMNDTTVPNGGRYASGGSDSPRLTYVVYRANISSTYATPELVQESRMEVVVYEPGSSSRLAGGIDSTGGAVGGESTSTPTPTPTTATPTPTPTPPPSNQPPSLDTLDASTVCNNWESGFFGPRCTARDVTVSWTASDPNGDSDIESVEIRVINEHLFGESEVASTTITSGDLTDQTETLSLSGDADRVVVVVTDDDGETDTSVERL
ncbi:hypothetical protein ACFQJC_10305 [Haloferax namakaokahaiae]|uniref:Flagellin n=1 Tax=Haloferax namakaokahaiae TaxID=1748331 RepID=A0ABD5ZFG9_9EURY